MGPSSQGDDRLWDEALDLVIRLQNDPYNPVTLQIVDAWRRRSPAHEEAWNEATEIHGLSGHVLQARSQEQRRRESHISRRLILSGSAAAAAGIAFLAAPSLLLQVMADHITSTGEIRRIALPD